MNEEKTKSFAVSKWMVYESYLKVCSKDGGAGIDKQTIDMFNENLFTGIFFGTGIGFHSIIVASQSLYRQTNGKL